LLILQFMERFSMRIGPDTRDVQGVTTAVSDDGKSRVTILGSTNDGIRAESYLTCYLRGEAIAEPRDMPRIGYVIEDQKRGLTRVVASPVGLRQIFWTTTDRLLSVASEPGAFGKLAGDSDLSASAIFQYVFFHCVPGPRCAIPGVSKLDAGHHLDWDGRVATVRRYWRPQFVRRTALSIEDAGAQLLETLQSAVDRSLMQGGRCGAFLSGGLDSSTVAGLASRSQPGIETVSMGFDAKGFDEMAYARIASRHFKTTPLEYYVTPDDVAKSLPDIAAAFSEPFGNSSAAAAFHCARIAREHGLDTLLAGDGGDEIFGGNERYAEQLVFERYARVPRLARSLLEPLVNLAGGITQRFPFGKAQSYIRQAKVPLPDRTETYNFLQRIAPTEVFQPELLHQVESDEPLQLMREEYGVPDDADAVARMMFLDWKFTLHDNDLVKVNTMCDLAGVQVDYPMLDPELVEFSLQIPSDWKIRSGELRWFYKQAMRGFLPQEIISKTKHGFGLPFGTWALTHAGLRKISEDALQSLSKRRYFKSEFLARAQRLRQEDHASYYGELVWVLMILELWLQRHMPRAGL
jgi:asparagine synthase (glutamine-hydrolysing)